MKKRENRPQMMKGGRFGDGHTHGQNNENEWWKDPKRTFIEEHADEKKEMFKLMLYKKRKWGEKEG